MEPPSPEDYSDGGDSIDDEQDFKQEHEPSQVSPSTASGAPSKNAPSAKLPAHLQKRRRVTRACDECRRKKIKCDGKQPCTHCTVYSYECTYDQPSNRRRNPAPQYVENLEHRVHRAETLLHILIPNLDLNDPGIDAAVAQGWIPGAPGKGNPAAAQQPLPQPRQRTADAQRADNSKSDTNLESMVRAVAQMDMDEQGNWDYHGHSSGLSFVRRMREQLGELMGPDTAATPFVKTRPMSQVLDSPKSTADSPATESSPGATDLPPMEIARQVLNHAINDGASLLRVVHQPSFWQAFEHLYTTPPDHYTNEDNQFLPLFHSAMALGHLFGKDEQSSLYRQGYENAIQQGFAHFRTARQLMDIADCRGLMAIQAVVFMILFLQSSAKLSQCYAYVGVALRSALRMGLHRAYPGNFDPVEAETRKRVFWVVRKMDVYVGAMLGLPHTLSDEDIDQDFPAEVDDEYVTREGILPMPEGVVSMMTAFNAHTRLVQVVSKICRKVYPIKFPTTQGAADKSYSVPFSVIREIESDLEQWKNSLPSALSLGPAPARYTRVQQTLRLMYAHAQGLLYRPFLHFTAMEKRSKPIDQRAYACAASYVNVSRNIIHITAQMKQKGLLNGSFWFLMYTTFFAIMSLVYFAAENPDNATTQAVMKDALEGRQILASLAQRSLAADRTTATLNAVFSRLPDWMREGEQNPIMTRKRQHEHSPQPQVPQQQNPQASRSHTDVSVVGRETPQVPSARRASTFPRHGPQLGTNDSQFDLSYSQSGASSLGPQTPTSNSFDTNAFAHMNAHNNSSVANSAVQQYLLPPNFSNPALPDLSAMMFPPADEPFGYPNQPLTTFENNQLVKDNPYVNAQRFTGIDTSSPMVPPPSRGREDHIEAQFFALPPYIEQRQQQQRARQQQQQQEQRNRNMGFPADAMNFSGSQAMNTSPPLQMPNGMPSHWQNQPQIGQDLSNINIQDIFGGAEWNPMLMNPDFRPQ